MFLPWFQGHGSAIDIFRSILPALPDGTQLHLIGNLMPNHTSYLEGLRKASCCAATAICVTVLISGLCGTAVLQQLGLRALPALPAFRPCDLPSDSSSLPLWHVSCPHPRLFLQKAEGLPVNFHIGVPAEKIEDLMHGSLVQVC